MYIGQHADAFHVPYHHRSILHHKLGIELVVEHFGKDARAPAELHIRQDCEGRLPDDWADFRDLVNDEDRSRMEVILRELYGDDIYERVNQKIVSQAFSKPRPQVC